MCWFQGVDDPSMPKLNRRCLDRWSKINPEWCVNILTNETISNYVPEYFDILQRSPGRSYQAKSDLIRILLLSKYGGIWVDASVFPMQPLSEFYNEIVNSTGFFSYRFEQRYKSLENGDRELASWFMCVKKPKYYLIEKVKLEYTHHFETMNGWKYFTFHQTIADLYDTDTEVQNIINNMVQLKPWPAFTASKREVQPPVEPSYMYKRPRLDIVTDLLTNR